MVVKMTKTFRDWHLGMELSFPDHIAEGLISKGVAQAIPQERKIEKTVTKPARTVNKTEE
jgi:hypothetical protein